MKNKSASWLFQIVTVYKIEVRELKAKALGSRKLPVVDNDEFPERTT